MDYVLIHGAGHDSWCWNLLRESLHNMGHRTWAPDLPCEDLEAGVSAYADVVVDYCRDASDDAVLIGHSLGGLTIPVVAERRSVSHLVFLASAVPDIGRSFVDQIQNDGAVASTFGENTYDDLGRLVFSADQAMNAFYLDCSSEVAAEAIHHLRPQSFLPVTEVTPMTKWPEVPITFVHGQGDRAISLEYEMNAARERCGASVMQIPGGHSPFLARPAALAKLLVGLSA
jgi:pimeloyl-ACP methyl ester carboxylesterase